MMKPELDSCQNLVTDDKNHHWLKDIGQLDCTVFRAIHFIATDATETGDKQQENEPLGS